MFFDPSESPENKDFSSSLIIFEDNLTLNPLKLIEIAQLRTHLKGHYKLIANLHTEEVEKCNFSRTS